MARTFSVLLLILCLRPAPGGPSYAGPPAGKQDAKGVRETRVRSVPYGAPLAPGVIARLGELRFAFGWEWCLLTRHGKTLVAFTDIEGDAHVVDLATRQELKLFDKGFEKTLSLRCASANGKVLATGTNEGTRLWDVDTGKALVDLTDEESFFDAMFSPDAKEFINPVFSGAVRIWDATTGKLLRQFSPRGKEPGNRAVSPDGKTVVEATDEHTIRIWDLMTGKIRQTFPRQKNPVCNPMVSPGCKTLAWTVENGGSFHLYDVATGKIRDFLLPEEVRADPIVFSPDGRMVAFQDEGQRSKTLHLVDVAEAREVLTIESVPLRRTNDDVLAFVFSRDSRMLGVLKERSVGLWDLGLRKELFHARVSAREAGENAERKLAFSSDGLILAVQDGGALRFWETATGKEIAVPEGHTGGLWHMAFSADGTMLATGSWDGSVQLWDVGNHRRLRRLQADDQVISTPVFSGNRKMLASCECFGYSMVRAWHVASGRMLSEFEQEPWRVWNYGSTIGYTADDGSLAVASIGDDTITLRDPVTGKQKKAFHPGVGIYALAFSPDGETLALCGQEDSTKNDCAIHMLDASTGETLAVFKDTRPTWGNLIFSPDGKLFAYVEATGIDLYEAASRKAICRFQAGKDRKFISLTITPSGRLLAIREGPVSFTLRGKLRQVLAAEDIGAGKLIQRFRSDDIGMGPLAFSPHGRVLAMGYAGTILLWDVPFLEGATPAPPPQVARKDLERLWAELASDDTSRAYQAVQALTAARAQAIVCIQHHLLPALPQNHVKLIADLDSPQFPVREAAGKELARLSFDAEAALRTALHARPSLEVRRQVEALLSQLRKQPLPREQLRKVRAIQVVEQVGTADARRFLDTLAKGAPETRLTREAQAALQRLAPRPVSAP